MKKLVLTIFLVIFAAPVLAAEFADTTLDTPTVTPDKSIYKVVAFHWYKDKMVAEYEVYDATGTVLIETATCLIEDWVEVIPGSCSDSQYNKQGECEFYGETWTPGSSTPHNDFTPLHDAVVGAGAVGQMYRSQVGKALNNICMDQYHFNITGTVE